MADSLLAQMVASAMSQSRMTHSLEPRRLTKGVSFRAVHASALAAFYLVAACSDGERAAPWFSEEAALRGIDFQHQSVQSGGDSTLLFPDIMGSGAALADLDGDGDLDAYLVQSGLLIQAGPQAGDVGPPNRLFFNQGDGRFVPAEDPGAAADRGYGMGVTAGDYDNDGDVDLYVTNVGPNVLLRNDGTGRFEDVSAAAGVDHPGFGTAAAFVDLDRDGDLDLFLVNYVDWDLSIERDCYHGGVRTYCLPTNYAAPAMDVLYRNDGDGSFTDVTEAAGIDLAYGNYAGNYRTSRPGLGLIGADFNKDGLIDLFVANDLMVDQLWINRGDLRFQDQATLWGCDVDEHGIAKAGMGVAAADVDDDADVDLLVVNNITQTDSFFRNQGGYFVDATAAVGLGSSSRRNTRFGVALVDFDNDGRLDLYHANGAIAIFQPAEGDPYVQPNVLYRKNAVGRFEKVRPDGGVAAPLVHTSRGLAYGDVDDDGGIDLLIVNRDAKPYLLMNKAASRGNWVRFRVVSREGRDAHGATVSLLAGERRLDRDVQTAGSYLASNDPRVHFGLGGGTRAVDVRVRWPTGELERFGDFEVGRTVELRQGAGSKQ